jgi:hypothetical protein
MRVPAPGKHEVSAGINRVAHPVAGPFTNGPYSGPHPSTLADTEARPHTKDAAFPR